MTTDRLFDDPPDPPRHRDPTAHVAPRRLAHTRDPETSKEAAAASPELKHANRRACLAAHAAAASCGLSDDEVADRTGLDLQEARRRCVDLRNDKLIEWMLIDDAPQFVRTAKGKRARVSILTRAGRDAL